MMNLIKFFLIISVLILALSESKAAVPDTIKIGNTAQTGNGGQIMTDQYPAIVISPSNSKLHSVRIYISTVAQTDSLRFIAKSNPSWSCSGIGGKANPFISDIYTLGFSENTLVSPNSWNEFVFDPPLSTSDTIYVWPDLLQMIQPRIEFAYGGFEDSLLYANCVFSSIGQNDYRCEFSFIENPVCPDIENVVNDTSSIVTSDTISSTAIIGGSKNIIYDASVEVRLLHPFEVVQGGVFECNISGCN